MTFFTESSTSKTKFRLLGAGPLSSRNAISIIWLFHQCQIFFKGTAFFLILKTKAQELYCNYCELKEEAREKAEMLDISDNWFHWLCKGSVTKTPYQEICCVQWCAKKAKVIQLLKNAWRTCYWYLKKYKGDPLVLLIDQITFLQWVIISENILFQR